MQQGEDALQAHVWIPAHCFFSRTDAQRRCWLWLLHRDGRVQALLLPAHFLDQDVLLPELARSFQPDFDAIAKGSPALQQACPLPDAPVVPLPRWAVSWGHPVQRAIRAFAEQLDHDVLDALGALEVPGPFFGSVQNYNRLVDPPAHIRQRRLRALSDFPAWLTRVLLEPPQRPDMFGEEDDSAFQATPPFRRLAFLSVDRLPARHASRNDAGLLLDAIDRGQNLIDAIAAYHGVDRALIRSPLGREPWRLGRLPAGLVSLLHALPAHARPQRAEEVEPRLETLAALPVRPASEADMQRLAQAFRSGWSHVWKSLEQAFPALSQALRDCRDFLAAALGESTRVGEPPALECAVTRRAGCRAGLGCCAGRLAASKERAAAHADRRVSLRTRAARDR